ncbi:hypothetical protein BBW65_06305 [Helicobacter enhydrae]|uniref:Highly acidic protein n=1 Tax=Helicobacter enhydrae TaxID=222136 RepID=A0A1B1U6T4_9HELI|nr:hypothetical protein [Helicobacter enhydrae]ANV98431.1 hypothetical protein BBW65_06305 [Helicobacter enhydrae]
MLKILVVNSNPVVQKILESALKRADFEYLLVATWGEFVSLGNVEQYGLVVFDDEVLPKDQTLLQDKIHNLKTCLFYSSDRTSSSDFTYSISKPFLPKDFLDLLTNLKQSQNNPLGTQEIPQEWNTDEIFSEIDKNDEDFDEIFENIPQISNSDTAEVATDNNDLNLVIQELENQIDEEGLKLEEEDQELEDLLDGIQDDQKEPLAEEMIDHQDLQISDTSPKTDGSQEEISEDMGDLEELEEVGNMDEQGIKIEEEKSDETPAIFNPDDIAQIQQLLHETKEIKKEANQIPQEQALGFLQNVLAEQQPQNLRTLLDGMTVTIHFSFPKEKE